MSPCAQPPHYRIPRGKEMRQEDMKETFERVEIDEFYESRGLAKCGSVDCAGCYEVEPGVRIHPPRMSESYRNWNERWEKAAENSKK